MRVRNRLKLFIPAMVLIACQSISAQQMPLGIHYQAVARDNYGKELANTQIDVRFTIRSGNPLGDEVYQELHQKVRTSYYGVFSLVIGSGVITKSTGSSIADVNWEDANHYIQVEVKFDNDFINMGTMQFLAVPYALFAFKSLEPGPQGPQGNQGPQGPQGLQGLKGEPGNPATDDQVLSFDGTNISISGGNTVNVSSLNKPHNLTLLGDTLAILGGNGVSLKDYRQNLGFNSGNNLLTISGGTSVDLTALKNDLDSDHANEIQDLSLNGNELTITGKTSPTKINLVPYLDNTDNQSLNYNQSNYTLSITNGGSAVIGSIIAFRARKPISDTGLSSATDIDIVYPNVDYNDGGGYNTADGIFTAPLGGIYTFNVSFNATGSGDSRSVKIFLNGGIYEILNSSILSNNSLTRSVTMKLSAGDKVKVVINTGMSNESGTGSFSGFRIY